MENEKRLIPATPDGEIFTVGGVEFIKFPEEDGKVPAVTAKPLFASEFGADNDLRNSKILKKLEREFLPKIRAAVGEEGLCTIHTDLKTLDGLTPYGVMESMVSLPTLDFYRRNVSVFDKHPCNAWWWLATAETAAPHGAPTWILCVSPSGNICNDYYFDANGVRPFLLFNALRTRSYNTVFATTRLCRVCRKYLFRITALRSQAKVRCTGLTGLANRCCSFTGDTDLTGIF